MLSVTSWWMPHAASTTLTPSGFRHVSSMAGGRGHVEAARSAQEEARVEDSRGQD
jgi:hypothetical protein